MTKKGTAAGGYSDAVVGMEEFGIALKGILREILRHHGVNVHTIDHRVKAERSAKRKIDTSDGTYGGYSDLHDLLGLRITCYFADEVDRVADIIDSQFMVDPEKSEDKRDRLGVKEFGYRSVHRVAWLSPGRAKLAEYARFKPLKFEVQIRTVLQHAWAEIEHDLGYKADTIPAPMSRRFSMLAGVLELVDYEFQVLRKELDTYEEKAKKAALNPDSDMALDVATLSSVIQRDPTIVSLDRDVAKVGGRNLRDIEPDERILQLRDKTLRKVGLRSISELRRAIEDWRPHIEAFVPLWLASADERRDPSDERKRSFIPGVGLFYLWLVMTLGDTAIEDEELPASFVELGARSIWDRVIKEVGPPPARRSS